MYSTVGLLRYAKGSGGKLVGTHQKLDKAARRSLSNFLKKKAFFPNSKEIIHFEGSRGPDGLKRKSPGVDEPMHFILPDNDDGKLWHYIENHSANLRRALKEIQDNPEKAYEEGTDVRAAFEAAWLAHAIVDGLTPAHHFPYEEAVSELMSDKDYFRIFGQPIKGIMRGDNLAESAVKNWKYWGHNGYMSKHIAFEYIIGIQYGQVFAGCVFNPDIPACARPFIGIISDNLYPFIFFPVLLQYFFRSIGRAIIHTYYFNILKRLCTNSIQRLS